VLYKALNAVKYLADGHVSTLIFCMQGMKNKAPVIFTANNAFDA